MQQGPLEIMKNYEKINNLPDNSSTDTIHQLKSVLTADMTIYIRSYFDILKHIPF